MFIVRASGVLFFPLAWFVSYHIPFKTDDLPSDESVLSDQRTRPTNTQEEIINVTNNGHFIFVIINVTILWTTIYIQIWNINNKRYS